MEHLIRKCEKDDLPALVALCQKHADYEQAFYDQLGKVDLLKQALFAATPKLYCYVIEINKQLGGYFSYTFDFSTWEAKPYLYLDCLYLEPEFRGLRIGEAVFEKLRIIAIQKNCINIQWQTPVSNKRAIKFYNRMSGIGRDKIRFTMDPGIVDQQRTMINR